ncbi:Methionyl-tRNA formyltransferase [Marasmius crinis-equi]|uniref:methionyl-tRNA formyltransferase n=1 Tax=Marasmius crinis-equi TaxID=585013 RepID=A0ABR3F153_9AGAR
MSLLLTRSKPSFAFSPRLRRFSLTSHGHERFKILFLGRDEFSCVVMQELFAAKDVWQNITVATNPDEKGKAGRVSSPLRMLAEEKLGLPVHLIPQARKDFKNWEPPEPSSPNHLLITASFGRILPSRIINLFPRCINVHPSLLPDYRGPAPIQRAIMNGETETGVCVIDMLPVTKTKGQGVDTGGVWGCRSMDMPPDATFPVMRDRLGVEGGRLLVEVLRDMLAGKATRTPQASSASLKPATAIDFEDALVDFTTMTADDIVRRDRAISHQRPITVNHPHPTIGHLQIHSPSVDPSPPSFVPPEPGQACFSKATKSIMIRCAEGTVLSVPCLKQEGKAKVDAKAWWNGAQSLGLVEAKMVDFARVSG